MYDYKKMKAEMFESDNASKYYKLYTIVVSICVRKGTFTIGDVLNEMAGDSWEIMCCIDYLEELGCIREIYPLGSMTQDRNFFSLI